MSVSLIVGVDGSEAGQRALSFAKRQAKLIGDCKLVLVCVVEWSPYTFQTAEENAGRKKQRQEEIKAAQSRVIEPALADVKNDGIEAEGLVKHGKAGDILTSVAVEHHAEQIIVARSTAHGLTARVFGSVTGHLVQTSTIPVTVIS